jgi:hypothetical protein
MLYENCLAHPTMMFRSEVLKKLKYKPYQKNIEDYDLWLRMLNRGFVIGKINEPLLFYRLHGNSVTNVFLKNKNFFFKHLAMKWKLLWHETFSGYINWYTIQIKFAAFLDLIKGIGKEVKKLVTL